MVDEIDHWAAQGIRSVAEFELSMLRGDFSDTYKEENGFRPDLSRWTEAEMKAWLDRHRATACSAE